MAELNVGEIKRLKTKISISIDSDLIEEFNKIAKLNKYNKSKTISNLIKLFVESEKSLIK